MNEGFSLLVNIVFHYAVKTLMLLVDSIEDEVESLSMISHSNIKESITTL
jgi:hypothetical protein